MKEAFLIVHWVLYTDSSKMFSIAIVMWKAPLILGLLLWPLPMEPFILMHITGRRWALLRCEVQL